MPPVFLKMIEAWNVDIAFFLVSLFQTHVILQTRDIALGEKTFKYKDCGDTTKNMLYAWHLCAYAALAYALKLAVMDAETGDKSAEVGDNDCG